MAARPAAVAGVVLHTYLVEGDHERRGALGALQAWPGRRGVGRPRYCSESNSQCGLHSSPLRNRDRGPVGALDAADVVVVRGIDVTSASRARLEQDQSLYSSGRHDADLYSAWFRYHFRSSGGHLLNSAVWHYTMLRTYVSILDDGRRLPDWRRCTTILLVSLMYPQSKRGSQGTSDNGY